MAGTFLQSTSRSHVRRSKLNEAVDSGKFSLFRYVEILNLLILNEARYQRTLSTRNHIRRSVLSREANVKRKQAFAEKSADKNISFTRNMSLLSTDLTGWIDRIGL